MVKGFDHPDKKNSILLDIKLKNPLIYQVKILHELSCGSWFLKGFV